MLESRSVWGFGVPGLPLTSRASGSSAVRISSAPRPRGRVWPGQGDLLPERLVPAVPGTWASCPALSFPWPFLVAETLD